MSDPDTQPEGVIFYQMSVRYATLNSVQVSGGVRVLLDLPNKTGYVQIISLANEVYASHFVNSMSFLPPTSAAGVAWSAIPWIPNMDSQGSSTGVPQRSLPIDTKVDTVQAIFWDPGDAQKFKTVLDAIRFAIDNVIQNAQQFQQQNQRDSYF